MRETMELLELNPLHHAVSGAGVYDVVDGPFECKAAAVLSIGQRREALNRHRLAST
jgi:hypothetical protein